ncbi:MAG TPA: ATP-binding protein [Bryobacteraceae bacterium]|nr:ATP-binding protein [Bryobacteraceae bacterium]
MNTDVSPESFKLNVEEDIFARFVPTETTRITSPAQARAYRWTAAAFAGVLAIGLVQRFTPPDLAHWHYILQRLYYIPVAGAGLLLGWRWGLTIALLAGGLFCFTTANVPGSSDMLDRLLECLVFCMVGILTGTLSDRERERRSELEQAKSKLEQVHHELKLNFEQMKRADRLSALGHLSAGLAHEIRNPLASIEGAASIVRAEPDNPGRRSEFLEIIQIECRRLNSLLAHFLEFARPRLPDFTLVGLEEIFDSVSSLASHAVRDDRTKIRIEIPPNLPKAQCDPEQLKQVLLNLVLNAVQAMPDGGTVVLSAAPGGRDVLAIRVRDEGAGVPQEHLDHIFDPFFTLKEAGTGLGLSVAHGIIDQHGGSLILESNGSKGAVFLITLPLRQHGAQ